MSKVLSGDNRQKYTEPPLISEFAKNVRAELKRKNKSIGWLSRQTGISQCMISYYLSEKSEPSLSKAIQIANVLQTPLSQLAGENLLNPKLLSSMIRQYPEAEKELISRCPTKVLVVEMNKRLQVES